MDDYLPNNKGWFKGASNIILRLTGTSYSEDKVSQSLTGRGPQMARALAPVGNDDSINWDRQIEQMISKPPANCNPLADWDQIHGNTHAKNELYANMVEALPRKKHLNNVLLFGPSGTGKTMMATCAARLAAWTVFVLTQDAVMQRYQGESEK